MKLIIQFVFMQQQIRHTFEIFVNASLQLVHSFDSQFFDRGIFFHFVFEQGCSPFAAYAAWGAGGRIRGIGVRRCVRVLGKTVAELVELKTYLCSTLTLAVPF